MNKAVLLALLNLVFLSCDNDLKNQTLGKPLINIKNDLDQGKLYGKVRTISYFSNDSILDKSVNSIDQKIFYNQNGFVTGTIDYLFNDLKETFFQFEYDSLNRLTTIKASQDQINYRLGEKYEYSISSNDVIHTSFNEVTTKVFETYRGSDSYRDSIAFGIYGEKRRVNIFVNSFDENDNLIHYKQLQLPEKWVLHEEWITYDELGRITKVDTKEAFHSRSITEFTYNKSCLISRKDMQWNVDEYSIKFTTYNKRGLEAYVELFDENYNLQHREKYEYDYDGFQNWVELRISTSTRIENTSEYKTAKTKQRRAITYW